MDFQDLLITALRATLVYFFVLLVIRLLGKRSVGAIGAFDLLVALMIGEVVDEAIFGDVSMVKGLLAITVVAVWHFANGWASHKSKMIHDLTEGKATVLVEKGQIKPEGLAQERMNEEELQSQLRLHSIADLAEVEVARLESNGQVSVIKTEAARTLQKADLKALKAARSK